MVACVVLKMEKFDNLFAIHVAGTKGKVINQILLVLYLLVNK